MGFVKWVIPISRLLHTHLLNKTCKQVLRGPLLQGGSTWSDSSANSHFLFSDLLELLPQFSFQFLHSACPEILAWCKLPMVVRYGSSPIWQLRSICTQVRLQCEHARFVSECKDEWKWFLHLSTHSHTINSMWKWVLRTPNCLLHEARNRNNPWRSV